MPASVFRGRMRLRYRQDSLSDREGSVREDLQYALARLLVPARNCDRQFCSEVDDRRQIRIVV